MSTLSRCFALFLAMCLLGSTVAQAQDLLKLFNGKAQVINIQTSAEVAKARMKKQLKQLRTQRKKELEGQLTRDKILDGKIASYTKFIRVVQKEQKAAKRKDKKLEEVYSKTIDESAHHVELVKKLQSVLATRVQSMDDLIDALALSLRVHESFLTWLSSRFPNSNRHKVLRNAFRSSQQTQKGLREEEVQSKRRLRKLRVQLQANNKALRLARRSWLKSSEKSDDLTAKRHTTEEKDISQVEELEKQLKNRRLRRSERRRLRKALQEERVKEKKRKELEAKQVKAKKRLRKLQTLQVRYFRQRLEACQAHARLLHRRLEDETFQNRSIKVRLGLYLFTQKEAGEALERMSKKAKGGLLYRSPPTMSEELFVQVGERASYLFRKSPVLLGNASKQLYRNVWSQAEPGLYLLLVVSVFLLALFALFGRRRMRGWLETLQQRDEAETTTQPLWRVLLLVSRSVYDLIPYVAIVLAMSTVLWAFQLPGGWNRMFFTLVLMLFMVRLVWTLSELLFADDASIRFLASIKDDFARRLRLVVKAFAGFSFLYIPAIQAFELLEFPGPFVYNLSIIFYGLLLVSLLIIFLSKEDVLQLVPTNTKVGRGIAIFLDRFYLLTFVAVLGLFGLYIVGYVNLAAYLARRTGATIVLLIAAYTVYQLIWTFGLWVFGFSRNEKGLVQIERRWARNLLRLTQWLSGIVLVLLVVFLSFEIWGVAYGFATIASLFTRPFFNIQKTQITLLSLLKLLCAVGGSVWLSRFLKSNLKEFVYPALRLSLANQHATNTVVGYVVVVVGLLFGLQWMGVGVGILAVFAGVIGIGVGFGLQNIANNFISGMILTFGQPIKVSDVIEVGGVVGIVREISPRSTTIETNDGKLILVPNADILTTKVINWSLGPSHIFIQLKVGVAYGSNVSLVRATMVQIAREHGQIVQQPQPFVRFQDFGASSLDFELWAGIRNPMKRFDILSDLRFEIERKFEELGIVIAFPQQDLHLNTDLEEALIHSLGPKTSVTSESVPTNGEDTDTDNESNDENNSDKLAQMDSVPSEEGESASSKTAPFQTFSKRTLKS